VQRPILARVAAACGYEKGCASAAGSEAKIAIVADAGPQKRNVGRIRCGKSRRADGSVALAGRANASSAAPASTRSLGSLRESNADQLSAEMESMTGFASQTATSRLSTISRAKPVVDALFG